MSEEYNSYAWSISSGKFKYTLNYSHGLDNVEAAKARHESTADEIVRNYRAKKKRQQDIDGLFDEPLPQAKPAPPEPKSTCECEKLGHTCDTCAWENYS